MSAPFDVLVLQHTHWDREWYHPAGRFRQRLVALVDELLARGADPREPAPPEDARTGPHDASFLLDGQAVVIEDYLAVRPECRDALARRLADGRLEAGPWYVLADELIPSGEALVRNLLAGRRALAALGAQAPPVLYSPDAFGHPAALPTLAAGFGARLLIAWRGYGGRRWPEGDAVWWRAPDGTPVLCYHLPRDGYEFGSNLPADAEGAGERWARMRSELAPRARLGVLLVQNGADHHAPQSRWRDAYDALVRAAAPDRVRRASLRDFAELAASRADASLPSISGELRDSYGYTWTLQGTFASRAAQKRRNAAVERLLLRDTEPWLAALALGVGAGSARRAAPGGPASLRPCLDAAWRTLLRCHPHDTLCGCSIDAVARAMDARLDDAASQAAGLRDDALAALAGHDPVAARERRALWRPVVTVRNRVPRPRGGVGEVELLTFLRDVPVGPGSAGTWRRVVPRGANPTVTWLPDSPHAAAVPVQLLEREIRHERIESPRHYPDDDLVEAVRAVVWLPPVPGYGTTSLALSPDGEHSAPGAPPAAPAPVVVSDSVLDNGLLRVAVSARGAVRVVAPALGVDVEDAVTFEDVGDAGDLYTHSAVGGPLGTVWCTGVRTVHRGPLRGEIEARYRMRVPAAAEPAEDRFSRPERRARRHVELPLAVRLVLDRGAPFVRVLVEGENLARDHRLRVLLATGVAGGLVVADAAFGPVVRQDPVIASPEDRLVEHPPATAPLHRYVARFGDSHAAAVFSDGLAEYEARDDGRVAVTLLRAVGELSRPDLPERPGHAGWPSSTPEAQSIGPFAADLALAFLPPSGGDVGEIERVADDVLLPLVGQTHRAALAVPPAFLGAELEGDGLAFAAMLPAGDGRSAVLRCVNVTDRGVAGAWRVGARLAGARLARLDETPIAPVGVEHGADGSSTVRFDAPPRAVVTILAEPASAAG